MISLNRDRILSTVSGRGYFSTRICGLDLFNTVSSLPLSQGEEIVVDDGR
jgi:hypothetical protein